MQHRHQALAQAAQAAAWSVRTEDSAPLEARLRSLPRRVDETVRRAVHHGAASVLAVAALQGHSDVANLDLRWSPQTSRVERRVMVRAFAADAAPLAAQVDVEELLDGADNSH